MSTSPVGLQHVVAQSSAVERVQQIQQQHPDLEQRAQFAKQLQENEQKRIQAPETADSQKLLLNKDKENKHGQDPKKKKKKPKKMRSGIEISLSKTSMTKSAITKPVLPDPSAEEGEKPKKIDIFI